MKKIYLCFLASIPFIGFGQNTCATAIPVTAGLFTVGTIDGSQVPDPICVATGNDATAGEWYIYNPTDTFNLTITTDLAQNSGGDTRFHVYTGTCGTLACYGGDDDGGVIGNGYLSITTIVVYPQETYYIAFDNRWTSTGFDCELTESEYIAPPVWPVTFTALNLPTITGDYRIAISDMNGDYLDDIITVSSNSVLIHYQQVGGAFTVMTIPVGGIDNMPGWSMAIGDIDKNGFNDMVLGGGNGASFLFANATGTGYLEFSTSDYIFCQRTNFVDINNDGHLDAFVCHDVNPNVFYMNDGNGNLSHNQGGIGDHPEGGNYGSLWVDYDNDGDPDLFIAKCRGGQSTARFNELHRNDGNGVFTNVSVAANLYDPLQTWSSAWNDYDNDGFMDVLVGASSTADGTHKLMHNEGDGTFMDITAGTGWDTNPSLNIEHITYDFDNDGYADVMGGGNKIMYNNGDLTFTDYAYAFGVGSIGDLNDDGFLDVQNGSTIYYNDGNDNNWLKVNVQGVESNYNGIGARVEIYTANGKQIRDVRSGEGFRHMHTLNVHFGIGTATEIDSVVIKWPSGKVDKVFDPAINENLMVVEGSTSLSSLILNGKDVVMYPNPTSGELRIDNLNSDAVASVKIISHLGQEVLILDRTQDVFDVSSLQDGLYILMIQLNNGERYAESFIKK